MRLPDNVRPTALTRAGLTLFVVAGLSACAAIDGGLTDSNRASVGSPAQAGNGPAADYPIIVGAPYRVGDVEHVPNDTLNYDHVGYVSTDQGTMGYSGAHHTLPIPSYVEVTSLETGRTVLVRLQRRGPMDTNHLLALSPAAMAQLGANEETPVRVRRVNPPETERFVLRAGDAAPLRMDTPQSLLTVLQRRLPASGAASLRAANTMAPEAPQPAEATIVTVALAASEAISAPAELAPAPVLIEEAARELPTVAAIEPTETPTSSPTPSADGNFLVQAAAFSTIERAQRVAEALGGQVTQSGRYFRVRTGPFMTRGEAEASLANVHSAGYSDARILTSG